MGSSTRFFGGLTLLGVVMMVSLMALNVAHCDQSEEFEKLIKVPYPERCSLKHVKNVGEVNTLRNKSRTNDKDNSASFNERFTEYVRTLHAYCGKMVDLKLAAKSNSEQFQASYNLVSEINDEITRVEDVLSSSILPTDEYLKVVEQFLDMKAQQESMSKQKMLEKLKLTAKHLQRIINADLAPTAVLEGLDEFVSDREVSAWPEIGDLLQLSGQCIKLSLVDIDNNGALVFHYRKLGVDYHDNDETESPLEPLSPEQLRQVNDDEGYQKKFDELARQ